MFKRVGLLLITNLIVMATIITILSVLGIGNYLTPYGIDYRALAIFSLVWGMGGALISLAMSRFMAKRMMGVQVIDSTVTDPRLRGLVQQVHQLAQAAGLPTPEVGIYQSPEPNAFATGPSKSRSLVAVSTGLLERMSAKEVAGVLSHEMAHIANGDMVTMTLVQGVVNAFAIFLARVIAYAVVRAMSDRENGRGFSYGIYFLVHIVLEIAFMFLGSIVIAWFSRFREFRADAGGARLGGRENMVGALEALQRSFGIVDKKITPAVQTLQISGHGRLAAVFSTHPPLEDRIARLRAGA